MSHYNEKIVSIEEVFDVAVTGGPYHTTVEKMENDKDWEVLFDGYKIKTTKSEYFLLIQNGQQCCESWGYFSTDDDPNSIVGMKLDYISFHSTKGDSETLKLVEDYTKIKDEEDGRYLSARLIDVFVKDEKYREKKIQFAVYNAHNGYYEHDVLFIDGKYIKHFGAL